MHRVRGAWKFAILSDAIHMAVNTDKMRFNTYIYIFLQQSLARYCLL